MTDYAGILSGNASASGPYAALSAARSYGVPTKKDKKASGIGGFFGNLGDDLRDLTGIPAGIYGIGKSAVHDAGVATGLKHGAYQLDDIGSAAVKGTFGKGTYLNEIARASGDLYTGDLSGSLGHLGKAGKSIYSHPLAPMLDAATVVTGGGALAGKVATKVATTTGSKGAMKLAGLQRVDEITPSTIRGVSGPAGKFAAATHAIKDPITGNTLHEMPVVRNPIVRGRKNLTNAALSKLPDTNYLGNTRRGARLGEAETRRTARREAANIDRAYMTAYGKLSKDEKDALVYIAQGFNTTERATALLTQRLDASAKRTAEHLKMPATPFGPLVRKGAASDKAKNQADTHDLVNDAKAIERVMPHIEKPSPALVKAIEAQRVLDKTTQDTFIRNMIREGTTPEAAQQRIRDRAQMPLRAVGITPDADEMPMILTHVENAAKRDKRGQSLERGMTTKYLDEERATTGENFLNARYERDASTVLTTHRLMFAKEQTYQRIERALSKTEPFDRAKHQKLLDDGKLHLMQKNDRLVADMKYVDDSLDRFEKDIGDFTDVETETLRDAYGAMYELLEREGSKGLVIPKAHYEELIGQFKGARGILDKITDGMGKLTRPWKHIVLSLKGSFYVNNFLGNMLLGLVAYGPRYILDVVHESMPAAIRNMRELPSTKGALPAGVSRRIGDEVSDLTRESTAAGSLDEMSKAARLDVFTRAGEKIAPHGAKLTENNFRRAAFRNNLRGKVSEYRKTQPGMTRHEAVESIFNDKNAVDQLAEATYSDLLDYGKLTPIEKELLLPAMPFWNFLRSMTGRTVRLTLDEPWKMRVLLYFGESGIEANEDLLPEGLELQHYLKGMILSDKTGETQRVMSTYGANPFTASIDMFSQLLSIGSDQGGSANPLSSFNPLIKVPLEALFDKDTFTGREIENAKGELPDGYLSRLYAQGRKNIPQLGMYDRYRYPSSMPAIERDLSDTAMQYAGFPVGNLNVDNIEQANAVGAAMDARDAAYRKNRQEAIAERARF